MAKRHDLMDFIAGGPLESRILVLDSSLYLPKLRRAFPKAELYAMTVYEEVPSFPEYQDLGVHWALQDYRKGGLPYELRFFDMILSESCMECLWDSYESLMDISRHIKETGHFLGMFSNVRYWRILEGLRQGEFPVRDRHFYAKTEAVRILNDALFKEIFFIPSEFCEEEREQAEKLEAVGFAGGEDLLTKTWMFRASCSKASVAALKEFYAPEARMLLARLLHRIEYDVEREESLRMLWELCRKEMIFPDYLFDFVEEVTVQKEEMRKVLACSAGENGLDEMRERFC